jgi:hypothetical protein
MILTDLSLEELRKIIKDTVQDALKSCPNSENPSENDLLKIDNLFKKCDNYKSQWEDEEGGDEEYKTYSKYKHSDCENCDDGICLLISKEELYDTYYNNYCNIFNIKKYERKIDTTYSQAEIVTLEQKKNLKALTGDFGHHRDGLRILDFTDDWSFFPYNDVIFYFVPGEEIDISRLEQRHQFLIEKNNKKEKAQKEIRKANVVKEKIDTLNKLKEIFGVNFSVNR